MKNVITCRPCKEQNNWEIEDQNGNVLSKHYQTKDACVLEARKLANECGATLCIENQCSKSSK